MKKNMKKCLKICSMLKGGLPVTSPKIILGVAGVLACSSLSMAAQGPALGIAHEAAIVRYASQYIGNPYGKHVLKGIVWVESKYGRYKFGEGSFGLAQIEVQTARYVAEKYGFVIPETDSAIEEMLVRDDTMNIRLAAAYLGLLEREFGSLAHAVVAYNMGPTEARSLFREGKKPPAVYLNKVMAVAAKSLRAEKTPPPPSLLSGIKERLAGLLNQDARRYFTLISYSLQPNLAD